MNVIFSQLKDAVSILRLDEHKMFQVSGRKSSTVWGIIILLFPPVFNLILASLSFPSGFGVIFSRFLFWPIFVPVLSIVGIFFLVSFVAQKSFGGRGEHIGFFRTMAYSSVVLWVSVVPFLLSLFGNLDALGLFNIISILAVIWMFAVAYKMLISYHKLSQHDAVFVLVIGVIGYFVLKGILGKILVGRAYRLWY